MTIRKLRRGSAHSIRIRIISTRASSARVYAFSRDTKLCPLSSITGQSTVTSTKSSMVIGLEERASDYAKSRWMSMLSTFTWLM